VSGWPAGTRWLVALGSMVAGLVIPFFVVAMVIGWAEPDPGSDMALGLYAGFLGLIAGLLGWVISAVLSVRWLRGSVSHFARWWLLAGLTAPVIFGLALWIVP
jgi:hypothetical protein